MKKFPTIGVYNQAIQKNGNLIFSTLSSVELIPSRTLPIKVYLFGSGAYAAVFKGKIYGNLFALRVFLEAGSENVARYKKICSYLDNIDSTWKVDCEFLPNEISVSGEKYPILKMNWVQGKLINDFVTENLHSKKVLDDLQKEIVGAANDLNKNDIGHGDIQSGNMMIVGSSANFQLKLIDYDGMYTPNQNTAQSIENGRSEFNHPDRSKMHFGPYVDRFPFWVMLCALEALKFDPSLWKEVMQGGFNTLDNFLFLRSDFVNPNTSKLIERLKNLRKSSIDFYLGKLISFNKSPIYDTELPEIYSDTEEYIPKSNFTNNESKFNVSPIEESELKKQFIIKCNKPGIKILSSNLEKIGSVPLELDKNQYSNQTVIATDGNQLKRIQLPPHKNIIHIEWVEPETEYTSSKNDTKSRTSSPNKKSESKSEKTYSYASTENSEGSDNPNSIKSQNATQQKKKSGRPTHTPKNNGVKSHSLKWLIIIPSILLALIFANFYFEVYDLDSYDTSTTTEVNVTAQQKELIRGFIRAEDERDWRKIKSFFSPRIRRYWGLYTPNYNQLKSRYEQAWNLTSEAKNEIEKIKNVRDDEYDLETTYTYYDKKKQEYFRVQSLVRFEFDENNKIKGTYAAKPSQPKKISLDKDNPYKDERNNFSKDGNNDNSSEGGADITDQELDTMLRKKILEFFDAEEAKDFEKLYPMIASKPYYFLGEYYPNFSEIKGIYKNKWNSKFNESIELVKIALNDIRNYDIELNESHWNRNTNLLKNHNYIKRIKFNKANEISFYKDIKRSEIKSENQSYSDNTPNNPSDIRYIYQTDLKYSPGPALRSGPSINSREIKECPVNTPIYVMERTNSVYYKVYVGGTIGYISLTYLKRQ